MRMAVDSSEDCEAEKHCQQPDERTNNRDREMEPTNAFEPIRFHSNRELDAFTLHHKVILSNPKCLAQLCHKTQLSWAKQPLECGALAMLERLNRQLA